MEVGDLHKVWELRALKRKPDEPHARALLDRIAKQVQPIMRRRRWRVKLLSEFSPKNPRLLGLNVNAGVEVKLRLRPAGRDHEFIPYEQVLDTMLHELCHIVRGPHDAQFYKLWDELRKECEELVSKGITGPGQGFDGTGRRLGGFSIHPPPPSLRQATLAAAQKRARNGVLLPSGPRKLGGNNDIMSALTPIQAAAMAAERRLYDDLWCGSHDPSGFDDSEDVVIVEKPPNLTTQGGKNTKGDFSNFSAVPSSSSGIHTATQCDSSSSRMTTDADISSLWQCSACTLLNQPLAPICEVCETAKPKIARAKYTTWSCKFCTLENRIKLDKCSACDQWSSHWILLVKHADYCTVNINCVVSKFRWHVIPNFPSRCMGKEKQAIGIYFYGSHGQHLAFSWSSALCTDDFEPGNGMAELTTFFFWVSFYSSSERVPPVWSWDTDPTLHVLIAVMCVFAVCSSDVMLMHRQVQTRSQERRRRSTRAHHASTPARSMRPGGFPAPQPAAAARPRRRPDLSIPMPQREAPTSLAVPLPLPPPSAAAPNGPASAPAPPPLAELQRVRRVGCGAGGTVWMVRDRAGAGAGGRVYALKVLYGNHDDAVRRQIAREIAILRTAEHPAVVRCHGMYERGGELQILLEYMDGGSLEGRRIASEPFLADVARQVLSGIAYLHRCHIVHRDIKPSNLLIDSARRVKIADFGVGRILNQTMDPCNSAVGTIAYMSPERINTDLNDGAYDGYAGDIWSFGLSILEFYLGSFPFGENLGKQGDWAALMYAICYSDPPEPPATASPEFRSFISCCLQKNPAKRLSAAQLLQHPFVAAPQPQPLPLATPPS